MLFSEAYWMRCFDGAGLWADKPAALGNRYVNMQTPGLDAVSKRDLQSVKFSDPNTIFVPDTDDLIELMDNQIAAWGFDRAQKRLKIEYRPEKGWSVSVEYGGLISDATSIDSIQMALFDCVSQMILFDPSLLDLPADPTTQSDKERC